MSHPFIKKYEEQQVDLAGFVQSVFDPTERLKDLSDVRFLWYAWWCGGVNCALFFWYWLGKVFACPRSNSEVVWQVVISEGELGCVKQMLTVHYYMLFDGADVRWPHMKGLYASNSTLS